jgi:hypothetical protein
VERAALIKATLALERNETCIVQGNYTSKSRFRRPKIIQRSAECKESLLKTEKRGGKMEGVGGEAGCSLACVICAREVRGSGQGRRVSKGKKALERGRIGRKKEEGERYEKPAVSTQTCLPRALPRLILIPGQSSMSSHPVNSSHKKEEATVLIYASRTH